MNVLGSRLRRTAARCGFLLVAAALGTSGPAIAAQPSVGWRGDATGRFPDATPPTAWSKTDNVIWKTKLPKSSYAGVTLAGDRLFVASEPAELLALRADTGEILWQRSHTWEYAVGSERAAKIAADHAAAQALEPDVRAAQKELSELQRADGTPKAKIEEAKEKLEAIREKQAALYAYPKVPGGSGNTAATAVSDGRTVFASFGQGIVSAHTLDGTKLWSVFVQAPTLGFGHSTSPVLAGGRLIVQYHDLVALDPTNGQVVWKTPSEPRYGSLVAGRVDDVDLVAAPCGTIVRAKDGTVVAEKLYRVAESSPVVENGVLYAIDAGQSWAYKLADILRDGSAAKPLWTGKVTNARRFASPLVHDGLLHTVGSSGLYDVLDAATGEIVLRKRLELGEGNVYPSPTLAGKLLYLGGERGTTLVVEPGREFKEVGTNELERTGGSPVFHGRRMYVRGREHVWCIGD